MFISRVFGEAVGWELRQVKRRRRIGNRIGSDFGKTAWWRRTVSGISLGRVFAVSAQYRVPVSEKQRPYSLVGDARRAGKEQTREPM